MYMYKAIKFRFHNIVVSGLLVSLALSPASLIAQQDIDDGTRVNFGGLCASQGTWTNEALGATNRLIKVIDDLKDDANCKGISESLTNLTSQTKELLKSEETNSQVNNLSALSSEIHALRGFYQSSGSIKSQVLNMLFNKSLASASQVAKEDGNALGTLNGPANMVDKLFDFSERTRRTAYNSMDLLEAIFSRLNANSSCMIADQSLGEFIGGSAQLIGAFVSSGPNMLSRAGRFMETYTNFISNQKFAASLRKLNSSQFLNSVACLIESTTENYCAARDTRLLINNQIRQMKIKFNAKNPQRTYLQADNPFQGYYLMVTAVPAITTWLQKVQLGVTPKISADADFQKAILTNMNQHIMRLKDLQAVFNEFQLRIKQAIGLKAKQAETLNMLRKLVENINEGANGRMFGGGAADGNYFLKAVSAQAVPFILVGREGNIPEQVVPKEGRLTNQVAWDFWMENGGQYRDFFNDPEKLLPVINENLSNLMDKANTQAINYYNNWFIVDQITLTNEAATSHQYSVIDGLRFINLYLEGFIARVEKNNAPNSLILSARDTQRKIINILEAYKTVNFKIDSVPTEEEAKKIDAKFTAFLEVVYDNFNIIKQRSGFVLTRMSNYVYADYNMMMKNGFDLSQIESDLLFVTGLGIIDRISQLYNGDVNLLDMDLSNALSISRKNIEALEITFKSKLIAEMAILREQVNGVKMTDRLVQANSWHRLVSDIIQGRGSMAANATLWDKVKGFFTGSQNFQENTGSQIFTQWLMPQLSVFSYMSRAMKYPERYPNLFMFPNPLQSASPVSATGFEYKNLSRLCIQTLAFNDWRAFNQFCSGIKLSSLLAETENIDPADETPEFKLIEANLIVDYSQKANEGMDNSRLNRQEREFYNHQLRVCAYRDWARRSNVVYQTLLNQTKNQLPSFNQ